MSSAICRIAFLDNSVSRIFKTVEGLRTANTEVHVFSEETEFLEFVATHAVDVLLLHLDLSPNDAIHLLKEIRGFPAGFPGYIIIYSDKKDDFAQELAFNAGADSFINFHVKVPIMQLFLRNLLRRPLATKKKAGREIVIDPEKFLIYKEGRPIQLPHKEFRIFELLYNNSGQFITKPEIADAVWHDETVARQRTIDVHIYNIRHLIGKHLIQSKKGGGYRFYKRTAG